MANAMSFVDPRAVSAAVRGLFATGEDAGAKAERDAATAALLRQRILGERQRVVAAERANAEALPAARDELVGLDTGIGAQEAARIRSALMAGETPQVAGTELTADQAGPRMPVSSDIVEQVRRSALRYHDPLSREHPQRIEQANADRARAANTARFIQDALDGKTPRDRLNAAVEAGSGRAYTPHRVQDHQSINTGTGALGAVTDVGQSIAGLNLARGGTEQTRQDALKAQAGASGALTRQRDARAALSGRTDPNAPRSPGGGRTPAPKPIDPRAARKDAEASADKQGLRGDARNQFVREYLEDLGAQAPQAREPLDGASPSDLVRRQFSDSPQFKGKKLGGYERGKGYAVYDGRKLIGHIKEQ